MVRFSSSSSSRFRRPYGRLRPQQFQPKLHRQLQQQQQQPATSSLYMVRNIDLVEALFFYGNDSIFERTHSDDESSEESSQSSLSLLPGVTDLIEQCIRDDTAVVMLLSSSLNQDKKQLTHYDHYYNRLESDIVPLFQQTKKQNLLHIRPTTELAPNPSDLWYSVHLDPTDDDDDADDDRLNNNFSSTTTNKRCITIQPKGFGGSSGFGTKMADPIRPPLPRHCVVLCTTIDQCRAARSVGMRCVCMDNVQQESYNNDEDNYEDNNIADAFIYGYDEITMDDIATPGSFWLNVCHERDDEGNKVDPYALIKMYNEQQQNGMLQEEPATNTADPYGDNSSNAGSSDDSELSDDELAAILADMDPL